MNILNRFKVNNDKDITESVMLCKEDKVELYKRLVDKRVPIPNYNILDIDIKLEYTVTCTLIYIIDMYIRVNLHLIVYNWETELFELVNS